MKLRLVAIAIALTGAVDPGLTVSRPVRRPLTVTILDTASLALPHGGETRRARAHRSAATLAADLDAHYDVTVRSQTPFATTNPCPADSACVVVSDGARPRVLDAQERGLGGVLVRARLTPNIAVTRIDVPAQAELSALAPAFVHLEAEGVAGSTTEVGVFDAGVRVGSASHTWPSNNDAAPSRAAVRVEWTPLATGVRDLHVVASSTPGEATVLDNEARTAIEVVTRVRNVLVYEPQPSWATTFVRRALEGDTRFQIFSRARLAPGRVVASKPVPLDARTLVRENIAVAIVASPQLLERGEMDALRRFAHDRGGSVVFLLDSAPSGSWATRVAAAGQLRREQAPVALGTIKVSEFIILRPQRTVSDVLASVANDPVIISTPFGHGRLIASGALDAWRYRGDGKHFDAFWRSLIADAATAAGEPLSLALSATAVAPGERVAVDVEWRSVDAPPVSLDAGAIARCGTVTMPFRLWPTGRRGRFRGEFAARSPGTCKVEVNLRPLATASASLRVFDQPVGSLSTNDELSAAVAAYGGTVVDAGDERALVTKLRALASPQRMSTDVRPLRSPWWIVPFTAALGFEWWLRRRRGLL